MRRATSSIDDLEPSTTHFYPRSPCGERLKPILSEINTRDFYPRSPCGERRWLRCWQLAARDISIHALLAESDLFYRRFRAIHNAFLSTLSLRRATIVSVGLLMFNLYFYPRSPCGERQRLGLPGWLRVLISIHALLAESDKPSIQVQHLPKSISIHALLAESDIKPIFGKINTRNFYPRSPCGERRWLRCWQLAARDISIHALLAESDMIHPCLCNARRNFYPRSPCGERRLPVSAFIDYAAYFYPRSPCGERRQTNGRPTIPNFISIHALLAESDSKI